MLNFFRFRKLQTTLVLVMLGLSCIPLLISGLITAHEASDALLERECTILSSTAQQITRRIDETVYERVGDTTVWALNPVIHSPDPKVVSKLFDSLLEGYWEYDLIVLADATGKIIASNTVGYLGKPVNTAAVLGTDVSREEWFQHCATGKIKHGSCYVSEPYVDSLAGRGVPVSGLTVNFAAPLVNEQGQVTHVLSNRASFDRMVVSILKEQEKELLDSGRKSIAFNMLTRNGLLTYDYDPKAILKINLKDLGVESAQLACEGKTGFNIERHKRLGIMQVNGFAQC